MVLPAHCRCSVHLVLRLPRTSALFRTATAEIVRILSDEAIRINYDRAGSSQR